MVDFDVIEGCFVSQERELVGYFSISVVIDTSSVASIEAPPVLTAKAVQPGLRFSHLMKLFLEVPWLHS